MDGIPAGLIRKHPTVPCARSSSATHRAESVLQRPFHHGSSGRDCWNHLTWAAAADCAKLCCCIRNKFAPTASGSTVRRWASQPPSAARDSSGMHRTAPSPGRFYWATDCVRREHPRSARPAPVPSNTSPATLGPAITSSWLSSRSLLGQSVIAEYLHSPVKRVDHVDSIFMIDEQSRRKLEFSTARAAPAKVVQQPALLVEHLHHTPQPV